MFKMKVGVYSHVGNSRQQQEDSVLAINGTKVLFACGGKGAKSQAEYLSEELESNQALFALSDGMGGHLSGEIASYYTLALVAKNAMSLYSLDEDKTLSIIADINKEIVKKSIENPELKGMGATLCGVVLQDKQVIAFNVGDSRIYSFVDGKLTQITKDHTEGRRLLELRLLNEEELETFAHRKSLYKYIGTRSNLKADFIKPEEVINGQTFLLCSDGLTDVVNNDEIEKILRGNCSIKEKVTQLVNQAVKRNIGVGDNISLMVIEFI